MAKKALLMILDGWGIGDRQKDDVIYMTPTPYWDSLLAQYPHSQLQASGENVGLPDGQMGNSEVGHLNIGAGRIVYQDLVKINRACADGSILKNKEIVSAFSYAKEQGKGVTGIVAATEMWRGKSLYDEWYKVITAYGNGLWVGSGFSEQTLFRFSRVLPEFRAPAATDDAFFAMRGDVTSVRLVSPTDEGEGEAR